MCIFRHIILWQQPQEQPLWTKELTEHPLGGSFVSNINTSNSYTSRLAQDLLTRTPSLQSFTSETDGIYIDNRLLTAINAHPSLNIFSCPTLTPLLHPTLTLTLDPAISLSRIHCAEANLSPIRHKYPKFNALFGRGAHSVSVTRLILRSTHTPGDWTETTFNNLQILEFGVSVPFARKLDAFIDRHRDLTDIILWNCGPKELEDFPCVAKLYRAVVERELGLNFRVGCTHIVRGKEARNILGEDGEVEEGKGMPMCAKKVKIFIEDRTEDIISCILENLPPCAEISLNFDGDDGRDFSINVSFLLPSHPVLSVPLPRPSSLDY